MFKTIESLPLPSTTGIIGKYFGRVAQSVRPARHRFAKAIAGGALH